MISREEIVKLASLSRLKLSEDEIGRMQTDMTSILAYVDKLKSAKGVETGPIMSVNKNIMREDSNPHEGGQFTDKLIALAPKKEQTKDGKFVKVKKILGGSQ
jgi:aspartyl-tRNA(Asn)/glutamyl-tRNA(Gln) amidotransferase subunit C